MIAAAGRLLDGFAGFGPDFRFETVLLGCFRASFSNSPNRLAVKPLVRKILMMHSRFRGLQNRPEVAGS